MGNRWGRGKGNGEERGGGQYTANLGSEWTGLHATTKEGFQVSKGRVQGTGGGISEQQRGLSKGLGHAPPCKYRSNCVYVMLIKDCV
jgi:hypothetical protein